MTQIVKADRRHPTALDESLEGSIEGVGVNVASGFIREDVPTIIVCLACGQPVLELLHPMPPQALDHRCRQGNPTATRLGFRFTLFQLASFSAAERTLHEEGAAIEIESRSCLLNPWKLSPFFCLVCPVSCHCLDPSLPFQSRWSRNGHRIF